MYALRVQHQPLNEDNTPVPWIPSRPGLPTRLDSQGKIVSPIRIEQGKPTIVPTGIAVRFESEDGKPYGLLVRDRSSVASKGIFITAGVIDHGYTGELKIIFNLTSGSYADIWPGDKIAQLIPIPISADAVEVVEKFEASKRGDGGFGSTGA